MSIARCFAVTTLLLVAVSPAAFAGDQEQHFVKGGDGGNFTATPLSQTVVRTHDEGRGSATHIGAYSMVAEENVDLATLSITDASFTITAENGDTLVGTYTGSAHLAPGSQSKLKYYVSGPITGGTGRFAGINGAIAFFGSADLATGKFSDIVVGVVPAEQASDDE